nr:MAG TPA: DnaJ domain protein [Caudoviricetes sp.]
MKPKEFITKFNLSKGWKSAKFENPTLQDQFLQDLTNELLAFTELYQVNDNITAFNNAVSVIRSKWNSISNKIPYGLPDGLWNYFFATIVSPLRDELCPTETVRRKALYEKRKSEYIRIQQRKSEFARSEAQFRQAINDYFLSLLHRVSKVPTESFHFLGLPLNASVDEITSRYRSLSLKYHPDRGGSQEDFINLTKHKNLCISWAQSFS